MRSKGEPLVKPSSRCCNRHAGAATVNPGVGTLIPGCLRPGSAGEEFGRKHAGMTRGTRWADEASGGSDAAVAVVHRLDVRLRAGRLEPDLLATEGVKKQLGRIAGEHDLRAVGLAR